jgi:hypothetical protein
MSKSVYVVLLVGGLIVLIAAYVSGGAYQIATASTSETPATYVLNKYTGQLKLCMATGCYKVSDQSSN